MNNVSSHRPFSAGPYAQIYPGSLVVEFNLSRQEIVDLNAGNRLLLALEKAKSHDTRSHTFAGVPDTAKHFLAVRAHEQDHLRRFLSTTFGFLCDTLRNQWVTLGSQVVAESVRRGDERSIPFRPASASKGHSFREALASLRSRSQAGLHLETLFRGHYDLLEALVDDATPPEFASALWALANGNVDAAHSLATGIKVERKLCAAYPMSDKPGRTSGLTARHILEFFAIGEHANGLLRTGMELNVVEELVKDGSREYATALLAWGSAFREGDWPDIESQQKHPDDLIIDWYRLFPFELCVAADLALWPPFFPNEDLSLEGELTWADIHPGHRFVKVLSAMQGLGVRPSVIPAEGRNERFLELQARICDRLGWPTPAYLTDEWIVALSNHLHANSTLWSALDGPVVYRIANSLRLLQARKERPTDTVLNNRDFHGMGLDGIPGWVFREANGRIAIVAMSRLEETALVPLIMLEGTRSVSTGSSYFFDQPIDSNFRNRAVDVFVELMAELGKWDAATRTRFLAEARRHFNVSDDFNSAGLPSASETR